MPNWSGKTGIDSSFLEMMNETVIFNATQTTDKYGKKTFSGTNISAQGRIIDDITLVKNTEGQDIVSAGRVILYGDYSAITLGHKITLPSGASPVIVKVESKNDTVNTTHHTIIHFGV